MLESWHIAVIPVLAFLCEYMDSTLGMGYGTTLTPLFMLMGYSPMQIVPVILLSELITGVSAGFFHHREGNVDFKPKSTNIPRIIEKLSSLGYVESFKRGIPLHLKVALLLAVCSVVGTVAAVFVAVNIPKFWLKLYIGCLVLAMGLVILIKDKATLKKDPLSFIADISATSHRIKPIFFAQNGITVCSNLIKCPSVGENTSLANH